MEGIVKPKNKQADFAKEEVLFKTRAVQTEKEVRALEQFLYKRSFIMGLCLTVIFVILGAVEITLYPGEFYGYFFVVVGLIYSPLVYLMFQYELSRNLKANKEYGVMAYEVEFFEKGFTCNVFHNDKKIEDRKFMYADVTRTGEDKQFYFVLVSELTGVVLNKAEFTVGDATKFSAFMKDRAERVKYQKQQDAIEEKEARVAEKKNAKQDD